MIRAFIFDLDGVITDTAEYHFRGWKRLAEDEGLSFSREDNEHLRGIARRESLMLILKDRSYPEEKIQEMMERKNNYYLEFIKEISPRDLLPGAKSCWRKFTPLDSKTPSVPRARTLVRCSTGSVFVPCSTRSPMVTAWNARSPHQIYFCMPPVNSDSPLTSAL